ncbi:MAG: hypothetical protein HY594_04495 [Candidatus Omnitrophica bacterium]|nr:hypothetical protein [Candidatus Omnitrophota bacterium]
MTGIAIQSEEYVWVASRELVEHIIHLLSVDQGSRMTAVYPLYHQATLSSLRGLGKEIWKGVDAKDYVDRLRDEWAG